MYFPFSELSGWGKRFTVQPKTIYSEVPKILSKKHPCSLSNYTKGALLYGVIPVCVCCVTALRTRGCTPCAAKAAILLRQKA